MELFPSLLRQVVREDTLDLIAKAESGEAREMVSEQLQSPCRRVGMRSLFFFKSEAKNEYVLSRDGSATEFMMLARLYEAERCFRIYRHKPTEPQYNEASPDFKLCWNDIRSKWVASMSTNSLVCGSCVYKKRTASVFDEQPVILELNQGIEQAEVVTQHWFYMDIDGISTEFGDRVVACKDCQAVKDENGSPSNRKRLLPKLHLQSVRPVVSKKGDLSIRFLTGGRTVQPSARNVQVKAADRDEDVVVFQFLKLSHSRFNIDFMSPLSPVQAFSIALSTHYWA